MDVKCNHPLAEIIAKKLSGIAGVPVSEQGKMVDSACSAAVIWYKKQCDFIKGTFMGVSTPTPEQFARMAEVINKIIFDPEGYAAFQGDDMAEIYTKAMTAPGT